MISVKIYKCSNSYAGYTIEGHAGFAQYGKDIVCASVSAIAQNLVQTLRIFQVAHDLTMSKGYMNVRAYNPIASNLIQGMHKTLLEIQEQYPSNISVKVESIYEEGVSS